MINTDSFVVFQQCFKLFVHRGSRSERSGGRRKLARCRPLAVPGVCHHGLVALQRLQRGQRREGSKTTRLQGWTGSRPEPASGQPTSREQVTKTAIVRPPAADGGRLQVAAGGLRGAVRRPGAPALAQRRRRHRRQAAPAAQRHVRSGAVRGARSPHAELCFPVVQHVGRSGRVAAAVAAARKCPTRTETTLRQQKDSSELHKAAAADHLQGSGEDVTVGVQFG